MNIWIITTGSSDVQLKTENNWNPLHAKVRNQLETQKQFISSKSLDGKRYLYPARVMGKVYGTAIETDLKYYEDLDFPLLNNFFWILNGKDGETEEIIIDRVIVLVTDQSEKFKAIEKNNTFNAFWQDTCTLEPILREYLKRVSIKDPKFLTLDPDPKKSSGLDSWNDVLERVQEKFKEEFADFKDVLENTTIYVSHQAGTPAISSAVQFCSLAMFGDRVRFLVSNEQNSALTDVVESSTYLRGIKREQAIKLLNHHDYLGVQDVLVEYLEDDVKTSLESAIQWNFAHFAEGYNLIKSNKLVKKDDRRKSFIEILNQNPGFREPVAKRTETDKWWWAAYEAAYLSFIRLKQGNTVEAVFHSFRSIEGLLKIWAEKKYPGELVNTKHPKHQENSRWDRNLRLYGEDLYTFLDMKRNIDQTSDFDIWVFGNVVIKRRNDLFHNIKGLNSQDNVFEAWRSSNEPQWKAQAEDKWKSRVLNCLNFIVKEDFPEGFKLEEASLMVKVHEELERAIDIL